MMFVVKTVYGVCAKSDFILFEVMEHSAFALFPKLSFSQNKLSLLAFINNYIC